MGNKVEDWRDGSVLAFARLDFVRGREGVRRGTKSRIGVTDAFWPLPASTLFGGGKASGGEQSRDSRNGSGLAFARLDFVRRREVRGSMGETMPGASRVRRGEAATPYRRQSFEKSACTTR